MTDESKITAAKLRIVTNNGEAVPRRSAPARPQKARRRFAQVDLDWFRDPAGRREISPRMRLYLLVQYLTKRGAREYALTNDDAAEVGLDRKTKHRYLRQLERVGLVKVSRRGQRNPIVSLIRGWQEP